MVDERHRRDRAPGWQLPRRGSCPRRSSRCSGRRHPSRLRLPRRERGLCRGRARRRPRLGRAATGGDARAGRQGRRATFGRDGGRAGVTRVRRRRPVRQAAHGRGKEDRLPRARQAERGWWRQRHARGRRPVRDEGRPRPSSAGGSRGLRRRAADPGTLRNPSTPRRGPVSSRLARPRRSTSASGSALSSAATRRSSRKRRRRRSRRSYAAASARPR